MTKAEQTRREQMEDIIIRLSVLTEKESARLWGMAGKFWNEYGYAETMRVLAGIWPVKPIAYICGVLKSEELKTVDLSTMQLPQEVYDNLGGFGGVK